MLICMSAPENEATAVVGIACRLPGAPDPDAFWRLLDDGVSAVGNPPSGRFRESANTVAAADVRPGAFLENVDLFDPEFFGMSPAEAAAADPQQRLVLELAWEALEEAGIVPAHLAASRTGVFVGAIAGDYAGLVHRHGPDAITRHTLTGLSRGVIANRVSYALDLRGPSLSVDSAQSSSLVAVHLALESLRTGESELALAAGVNLNLAPDSTLVVDRFGALSPDNTCFTFDARANGYARGEGAVLLVLKPLARALADGDQVHAVLLGSAVGSDGATSGLTVPGAATQAEVIRAALNRSGVDGADVQYVELHGTGTRVGDPVEAVALGEVFAADRAADAPLLVGSAKTNVGHLEGASGIVGLLKTVLSVRHGRLPAGLNFATPNPDIPFDSLRLRVPTESGPWPRPERQLLAGVSSFGVGGTNAHVVVSGAPERAPVRRDTAAHRDGPWAWPLSAHSPQALRAQAARLRAHVTRWPDLAPRDIGYTLATTRTAFAHRAVVTGGDRAELLTGLAALESGEQAAGLVTGRAGEPGGTVFVFPGQGSQWPAMARELLDTEPDFAATIDAVATALAPHTDWSLHDLLRGTADAPSLERADVVQPALFAVMVSLAALWQARGVHPDAVIGHSQGEIAAAHVAGALTLEDAAALVALRARAITELAASGAGGGMASVPLPEADVRGRLEGFGGALSVAAVNGPSTTVVSGDRAAVEALVAAYTADGVRAKVVPVDYASHSPEVEPLRDSLPALLAPIRPRPARISFYSTVTGGLLDGTALDPAYWYRNLRSTVRFRQTVEAAHAAGHRAFVEVSPHPVLTVGLADLPGTTVTGTLRRDHGGPRRFLTSLAELHVRGGELSWPKVYGPEARRVPLPTYAFQRRRIWLDALPGPEAPTWTPTEPEPALPPAEPVNRQPAVPDVPTDTDLLRIVRSGAALVLGQPSPEAVDPDLTFRELGFDSVSAVEFRDRLAAATGLDLPSTLTYDRPTARAVADHVRSLLAGPVEVAVEAVREPARGGDDDPIAIVSLAGRWPGGADTPEELWALLRDGRDAVGDFPDNRGWDLDTLYDPEGLRHGTSYTRQGGFLHEADRFDGAFFGLGPRESAAMDPQQRLLLESSWELLERAGIVPATLRGTRTGVFVGVMPQDYGPRLHETPEGYQGHALTGTLTSVASGRLAYTLGLEGPAITVDTACSSSLVALHLAAQSLRSGETDLALAGGATVMSGPGMFTEFSRQRGLAPDGRCKPFAAAADGTAWAEGVGLVLLERLSDARRHGHRVLALVRASAVNQDGASNGLTAPNGPSQERVIRQALASAGLRPGDVDAVEAHGTGTALGDPIEAQALIAVYGKDREAERPLLVGSAKSNIGHTQAAAGVTGVIKLVQALEHGELPGTLHVDRPTPHVDWSAGAVSLLTASTPWPATAEDRPRRAGVSSFGISGTNAHLILESAPPAEEDGSVVASATAPGPWILSARDDDALRDQAGRLLARLESLDGRDADIGWSLAATRSLHDHRAVVLGDTRAARTTALRALAEGTDAPGLVHGPAAGREVRTAVLFPGQGSQRPGAGRALYETHPVFTAALDETAALFDAELDTPLLDVLFAEPGSAHAGLLDTTAYTQPVLFALGVALYRLAASFGVRADAFIGHSIGELTAAHLAGVLSLPDAVRLVAARGRLMQALPEGGAMAALQATEAEAASLVASADGRVSIAAVNGPTSVVVSGDADDVRRIAALWSEKGRRTKLLTVSHAFHSPHMDAALEDFRAVVASVQLAEPVVPVVSNLTGRPAAAGELTDPDYWVRHIREAVRFHDGLGALRGLGVTAFLELGPDAVLTSLVEALAESGPDDEPVTATTAVAALRSGREETRTFTEALARLHVHGTAVDWRTAFDKQTVRTVDLPTYPFQRRRHWLDVPSGTATTAAGLDPADHPLLGASVELPDDAGTLYTGRIALRSHPWLADHTIAGRVILPGAAFADLALHASGGRVEELTLEAPFELPADSAVRLQLALGAADETGRRPLTVHSRAERTDAPWTRHASGFTADVQDTPGATPGVWPPAGAEPVDLTDVYDRLADDGYQYGPAFRLLTAAWRLGDEVYAEVGPAPETSAGHALHPALLDAALHAVVAPVSGSARLRLPFAWEGVSLYRPGASALRVRIRPTGDDTVALQLTDTSGELVADVAALTLRVAPRPDTAAGYRLEWIPADAPDGVEVPVGRTSLGTQDDSTRSVLGEAGGSADDPAASPQPVGAVTPAAVPDGTVALTGSASVGAHDHLLRAEALGRPVDVQADSAALLRPIGPVTPAAVPDGTVALTSSASVGADDYPLRAEAVGRSVDVQADSAAPLRPIGPVTPAAVPDGSSVALTGLAFLGAHDDPLRTVLAEAVGRHVDAYDDPAALPRPLGPLTLAAGPDATAVLDLLQRWLALPDTEDTPLVLVTRDAVAIHPGEDIPDPDAAAVWGLVRTAQAEHPGRFALVDLDTESAARLPLAGLAALLAADEAQVAVRGADLLVPRLTRAADPDLLAPPPDSAGTWRLDAEPRGSLDGLALLPAPEAAAPLGPGQVRIALRATGLNFRDVLIALGMYPGEARIGAEGAGVVLETGPGVTGIAPGDRVTGLVQGTLGPVAVTDHRLLVRIPDGWSFARAAGVPVVFLTAYYGLFDLAELQPGERVLIHSAAGGVGQAAVQLAGHRGAEVYATAHPAKWDTLRGLGLPDDHIASSRTLDFEDTFRRVTPGVRGVDVVLNSLAREFTDASLRLLAPEGRFVEMGKTDWRDAAAVAAEYDGAAYLDFDLFDVSPDRIGEILAELFRLFAEGALEPLQFRAQDVRRAPHALRRLGQARHTGKLVLTSPPPPLDPAGTVLITGGTGTLGSLVARRLVTRHGVRHLLLTGRQGPTAPGATELHAELAELGAKVTIAGCDVGDSQAVDALIASVPTAHPLTAVVHTAGALDDTVLTSLTPERLAAVARPKADGAWHLHRATAHLDLSAFVLFSSAVGVLGNAGQANYAAANAQLDALAQYRRVRGLPAVSLAWGHWAEAGGMAAGLGSAETDRLARTGLAPMTNDTALTLFDTALTTPYAVLVAAEIDAGRSNGGRPTGVLRDLAVRARPAARPRGAIADPSGALRRELEEASEADRRRRLLALVRATAAAVLGHTDATAVRPAIGFMESGFDSLGVIELRNRLGTVTGLRLPSTVVLDHPTPTALADHLDTLFAPAAPPAPEPEPVGHAPAVDVEALLAAADDDEIFDLIDNQFGISLGEASTT
jgi:acyl transferase domain-containing protein/NADPH:quinone reductase-like Zn-dependent oxidoreductase